MVRENAARDLERDADPDRIATLVEVSTAAFENLDRVLASAELHVEGDGVRE